jgi:hypothetical protein
VVTVLVLTALTAQAFGPYSSGQKGYDISWPQCKSATLPSGMFGIVGVNNGRPFTNNPCLAREYVHAAGTGTPSLYINLAYAGAYRKNITPACSSGPSQAWMIGCSEADYSAGQAGGLQVAMWWLDIETGNSWSTKNKGLNQTTIQGAVDRLIQLNSAIPVGVYSTQASWTTITGQGYTPHSTAAEWVAGANGACTPFDANAVWLTQVVTNNVDVDTAC